MPTVYLFYKGRGGKLDKGTSDEHYQDTFMSAYKRRLDQRIDNPSDSDENLQCREDLLDIDTSINDTLHWALDNHKEKQILVADGDEEGTFRIAKVPAGDFRIVARGQAGANDAVWDAFVAVSAGKTTTVKLAVPGKSCLADQRE